jgi:hypothetical protein
MSFIRSHVKDAFHWITVIYLLWSVLRLKDKSYKVRVIVSDEVLTGCCTVETPHIMRYCKFPKARDRISNVFTLGK